MPRWYKTSENRREYKNFVFEYDNAFELGVMVAESGCGMANPYEINSDEFSQFNEGFLGQRKKMTRAK